MKNIMKKFVSLVLVCLMVFSIIPVSYAAGEAENVTFTGPDGETFNHYPQILVTGFGSGCVKIYYEDDPEQKSLFWPFESERFITNLGNVGNYVMGAVKENNPDILHSVIYNYIMDCFGMLALNPDGTMMEGVTTEPVGVRYTGDGKYDFYYDCRLSPLQIANDLHDAIDQVLAETGSEKVELVGSSYGANVVTAYMYLYEEELDKVDTVLQCVPSIGGIRFLGELFSGNFDINPIALCDFIDRLATNNLLPDFLYLLEEAGLLSIYLEILVVPALREVLFEAVVDVGRDFLASLPAVWACIPDEYFESAMIFLYGENYNDPDHKYAQLIAQATDYHYNVANKAAEIYTEAENNHTGLNMAFITKFGIAAIPFGTAENIMDDGLVTVPVSSFGATCANYGEKLPTDYKQQKYTEYNFMCPEWNIDASTGAFPFTTWYIKGLEHTQKNTDYLRLVDEIIYKDIDVFSDETWPQYLKVSDEDAERLVPVTTPQEKEKTLYDKLFAIFRKIILLPKTIFDKTFGKVFK
ncbi:MAG: alpha/beta hydrolase [Clostridia bacterium]|nr:alpha/beta hydrolase [Clostridia bacterium]